MIQAYSRPETLDEAINLLSQGNALPLGGGTTLTRNAPPGAQLVDLQALGLDTITPKGNRLEVGAMVRLQALLEFSDVQPALQQALRLESPLNLRNMRTIAGALMTADGRSPFATALLALNPDVRRIIFAPGDEAQREETVSLGTVLIERHTHPEQRQLLLGFTLPRNVHLAFEYVARTPADRPLLSAALAQWPSGRTRLVMGGWGQAPTLAMDGAGTEGLHPAARNACYEAADDFASAEYRRQVGPVLAKRALESLEHALL